MCTVAVTFESVNQILRLDFQPFERVRFSVLLPQNGWKSSLRNPMMGPIQASLKYFYMVPFVLQYFANKIWEFS